MGVTVVAVDDRNAAAWDRFVVSECPEATFFHRLGWKQVVERVYGQAGHYLYAERDGRIVGVLPLILVKSPLFGTRLISTAFTIGGGVAAIDDEARHALDDAALCLMDRLGASSLEYRQPPTCHAEGWVSCSDIYATFDRPIPASEEECLKQIPRKQRAVVRKSIEGKNLDDRLEGDPTSFFPLYAFSMRNMGTPVFGRRFFVEVMKTFGSDCDCLTVTHQGRPLSSVLSFYFRDRVQPYYTGCQPEARDLGANDYMYWKLMRRSVARGYTLFDFGRSKFGTGPFNFKKNWGFEPKPVTHEFRLKNGGALPEINPLNPKYRAFIAVWKRLPLPLANLLGPHVIRHIG
ncbi:FemAB family XrtA/PEP-CTERM system-associated protein [Magnetospirillum molischianum]|uniref:BioF2-like acetyltransferase domain-containing protein n=1 Tax=Magnetospirillum molischianum DSM 120 TaxID=1150626 RepID=H8FQB0_MAGML|nr:FemAB family XrtA/PEP-CTERM system-associated protein [Magnetospirillum molischianum]CCG40548.1 conserved hypothetical protein [Magnetospirillum molischianum DSM 120]